MPDLTSCPRGTVRTVSGRVSVSTMHLAKGLEFRAVAVVACDRKIIPLEERLELVGDLADLPEVYDTERHLSPWLAPGPAITSWSPGSTRPPSSC